MSFKETFGAKHCYAAIPTTRSQILRDIFLVHLLLVTIAARRNDIDSRLLCRARAPTEKRWRATTTQRTVVSKLQFASSIEIRLVGDFFILKFANVTSKPRCVQLPRVSFNLSKDLDLRSLSSEKFVFRSPAIARTRIMLDFDRYR